MHVAIILDRSRRQPARISTLRGMIQTALLEGVDYLTLDAFSATDASSAADEHEGALQLLCDIAATELERFRRLGIRVTMIGDLDELPTTPRCALERLVEHTAAGARMRLSFALGHGGRRDIVEAARWLAVRVRAGLTLPEEIDEAYFRRHLSTRDLPPVDLLIRTGAQSHASDSLLFEAAHAQLVALPSWPDLDTEALRDALTRHSQRPKVSWTRTRGAPQSSVQAACTRR